MDAEGSQRRMQAYHLAFGCTASVQSDKRPAPLLHGARPAPPPHTHLHEPHGELPEPGVALIRGAGAGGDGAVLQARRQGPAQGGLYTARPQAQLVCMVRAICMCGA